MGGVPSGGQRPEGEFEFVSVRADEVHAASDLLLAPLGHGADEPDLVEFDVTKLVSRAFVEVGRAAGAVSLRSPRMPPDA